MADKSDFKTQTLTVITEVDLVDVEPNQKSRRGFVAKFLSDQDGTLRFYHVWPDAQKDLELSVAYLTANGLHTQDFDFREAFVRISFEATVQPADVRIQSLPYGS